MVLGLLRKFVGLDLRRKSPDGGEDQAWIQPSTGGAVLYAIGDIHGRHDLLTELMGLITEDISRQDVGLPVHLIFLGDYVDRGPDSRRVIEDLIAFSHYPGWTAHFLRGNHEDYLLGFLREPAQGERWISQGGKNALESYGVGIDPDFPDLPAVRERLLAAMPSEHLEFLLGLELILVLGDYVFVHAGVRPGVALDDQSETDLIWIREPFLSTTDLGVGKVVVHGHTPSTEVQIREQRVGVDTGAWMSGRLSAVRLFEGQARVLTATGEPYARVANFGKSSVPA